MALHVFLFLLLVCLFLSLARLGRLGWLHLQHPHSKAGAVPTTVRRLLKPRTPLDCPLYRLASAPLSVGGPAHAPLRPWHEGKSRRGARHPREHRGLRLSQPTV